MLDEECLNVNMPIDKIPQKVIRGGEIIDSCIIGTKITSVNTQDKQSRNSSSLSKKNNPLNIMDLVTSVTGGL